MTIPIMTEIEYMYGDFSTIDLPLILEFEYILICIWDHLL